MEGHKLWQYFKKGKNPGAYSGGLRGLLIAPLQECREPPTLDRSRSGHSQSGAFTCTTELAPLGVRLCKTRSGNLPRIYPPTLVKPPSSEPPWWLVALFLKLRTLLREALEGLKTLLRRPLYSYRRDTLTSDNSSAPCARDFSALRTTCGALCLPNCVRAPHSLLFFRETIYLLRGGAKVFRPPVPLITRSGPLATWLSSRTLGCGLPPRPSSLPSASRPTPSPDAPRPASPIVFVRATALFPRRVAPWQHR